MAIEKPVREITVILKEELASKETRLSRMVYKNPETGFMTTTFPVTIWAESITYELDPAGNKLDIYDRTDMGTLTLTDEEIMMLWAEQVTLSDGSTVYLGNLLADKIDAVLRQKFGYQESK